MKKTREPPYADGTKVVEMGSTQPMEFLRFHGPHNALRPWLVQVQDVVGLSAADVAEPIGNVRRNKLCNPRDWFSQSKEIGVAMILRLILKMERCNGQRNRADPGEAKNPQKREWGSQLSLK